MKCYLCVLYQFTFVQSCFSDTVNEFLFQLNVKQDFIDMNKNRNCPQTVLLENTVLCDSTWCSLVEFNGISADSFLA